MGLYDGFCKAGLSSPAPSIMPGLAPHTHIHTHTFLLPQLPAGVGPKGWANRQGQRVAETGPRGLNRNGHEHRYWKKTDVGLNPAMPFPM